MAGRAHRGTTTLSLLLTGMALALVTTAPIEANHVHTQSRVLAAASDAKCQCLASWTFQGRLWHSCSPTGWCIVPNACTTYQGTLANSTPPSQKWGYCSTPAAPQKPFPPPPPLAPSPPPPTLTPIKLTTPPANSACQCLESWTFQSVVWHSCLSTGWCIVSNSCGNYKGLLSDSSPPYQKWAFCTGGSSSTALPPSPVPSPWSSCGFLRRDEDADLVVRTAGIQIWTCQGVVDAAAVRAARRIMEGVLQAAPQSVLDNLIGYNTTYCIFGRDQVLTDLPPFAYLANQTTFDGRSYSDLAGVGAVVGAPETAVDESNLLWLPGDPYTAEPCCWDSIGVHEFTHTVEDLGLGSDALQAAAAAFIASVQRRQAGFDRAGFTPYAWTSYTEYWAVLSQGWLGGTGRTDTNLGLNTRAAVKDQEPALAQLMAMQAYGAGSWTYAADPSLPHRQAQVDAGTASSRRRQAMQGLGDGGGGGGHYRSAPREGLRAAAARRRPEQIWRRP